MSRRLRILYAAGPGDVLGTYRHWKAGRDDPSQVSVTYSGQFYDVAKRLDAEAYVIGSHPRRDFLRDGPFTIVHRPIPLQTASGALYHVGQTWSALRLLWRAILFRADVLLVVCGTCYWFPLRAARWFGIKVIPTMHCVIWPKGTSPRGVQKLVTWLNRKFFTKTAGAIMTASHDIAEQVSTIARGRERRIFEFLPSYRPEQFKELAAPPVERTPFRVLFAGRIERNKGVFDLLEIAKRFEREGRGEIEFDLCGTGGALEELRGEVGRAGVGATFRLHGHCDRATMRRMFEQSHVVIVPTTTQFLEGFNQVVAEGVLSGRPVITSSVCPALDYVKNAVIEVPPDDVKAYGDAILKLRDDARLYEAKAAACREAQAQFYDDQRGWAATFLAALRHAGVIGIEREGVPPARDASLRSA
jgi:glycosyltransferase involved in cell wall biosynthesis